MAKILKVNLYNVPESVIVGDTTSVITLETIIEFHEIDLKLGMEYLLYLFVYDVNGKLDIPILIPNWDESHNSQLSIDRNDDFLGEFMIPITAKTKSITVKKDINIKLGVIGTRSSHYTKRLETYAVLVPAVGVSAKWSKEYLTNIKY